MLNKHANLYEYDGVRVHGSPKKCLKLGFPVPSWIEELGADIF